MSSFQRLESSIQKNVPISIHQQLVTQISMQIAAGVLPAGTKLPSIRGLSKKLDIHYNTCLAAYHELEELGLVEIRQGSGAWIKEIEHPEKTQVMDSLSLDQLAEVFVAKTLNQGYDWPDIEAAIHQAYHRLNEAPKRTLMVTDLHPDILPLFQAELSEAIGQPVETHPLEDLLQQELPAGSMIFVNRYHAHRLKNLPDNNTPTVVVMDVSGAQEEIRQVKALKAGALVLVISQSSIVLQQAEAVIHALRGNDLLLRTIHPSEGVEEIENALYHANLVFADTLCVDQVQALSKKPVQPLRVIPDSEMDRLQALAK
ncbi:MAG: GntR family transcriptional regulator [Vampirovibrio sp.]|nr:GntR family transcriptional regulator [Vampirovibrio sp.]